MAAMLSSRLLYLQRCSRWFSASRFQLGSQKADGTKLQNFLGAGTVVSKQCLPALNYCQRAVLDFTPYNGQRKNFHTTRCLLSESQVVNCPAFAESITEGDIRFEKAVGDFVNMDELVGEIETDKTNVALNAPCAGVIEELLVSDGDTVSPGTPLLKIKPGKAGDAPAKSESKPAEEKPVEAPPKEEPKEEPKEQPKQEAKSESSNKSDGPIPTSPPPVPPKPTGPTSSKPTSSVSVKSAPSVSIGGGRGETRVKMTRMRIRIAERLKAAQSTCAMLTTFNEIDMSNIMEMRATYKDAFQKKTGLKLGFMSAFVKASAYALQDQPVVNAVIDNTEIVYRDYVDISVAVSTPKGLVVPVLRNVETMNFADIEKNIAELGVKARDGNLAIEDMDGGTFTISNGGVFGSLFGTPIINPPQSSILGMHGIFDRPVAINGKVEIRPMMFVALTYDHRLIDGREAVTFLRKIKSSVEDPRTVLLEL